MTIIVPLYVHSVDGQFDVRPLFFPQPSARAPKLERALHQVTQKLRETLHFLGKELRHDELARYTFNPELDYHRLDVTVDLRRRVAKSRFLFVIFEALDRRIAFTPTLPDLWFEVNSGQTLATRANEVLSQHFRNREKEDEENFVKPEDKALEGTAWIHPLEMEIHPAPKMQEADDSKYMFLGAREVVDGERELFRIGRCLDHLFPDDLDRVLLRDRESKELSRLLNASDTRPVMLLGPAQVGKTALLHEHVYQTVLERKDKYKLKELTFLISPQRLISGMSYVGQWENRMLAILREARKKRHLLFFDDLLGLYHAGVTGQSDLSAAHVLKPYVERRDVRLLAEMTPEALRVLRERDRGFADLFHVLPLHEPSDGDTLRILVASQRQLEGQHQCRFAVDTLPAVIDVQRRYARHAAFPGKAAHFLRRLAVKHQQADISRSAVLQEFQLQSGLSLSFLDTRDKLERQQILGPLQDRIIGQRAALEAAADVISIAKARLNDPDRPLGTLLFLGPTGVGKTQCAKAIAAFLFGAADKLLRFDMNEFVEPGAAARLIGTFLQPQGLLTSAVRRQPFAVVLLDEIEKAHPEVFDLLLQVLGEGRLTDAHGRLADFSNTIVILTSNLGAREAVSSLGFRKDDKVDPAIFVREAERFFRPEFFNRLDRIVPFGRLTRDDVGHIATGLIQDVLCREGLVRHKCLLQIEREALAKIVDKGFDPRFGARVLKRAIERHLTRAVSERVAEGLHETFTNIHVYAAGREIAVHVQGLSQVAPNPDCPDLSDEPLVLEKAKRFADRILMQCAHLRPRGDIDAASADHCAYFTIQASADKLRWWIRRHADALEDDREQSRHYAQRPPQFRSLGHKKKHYVESNHAAMLQEMAAAQDIHLYLKDLADRAPRPSQWWSNCREDESAGSLLDLVRYASYVQTLADCVAGSSPQQVLLHLRAANPGDVVWLKYLATKMLPGLFDNALALEMSPLTENAKIGQEHTLLLKGLSALPLARLEEGTHLFCPNHGGVASVQLMVWPVPANCDTRTLLENRLEERADWQKRLARGEATVDADPFQLMSIVCVHQEQGKRVDLRSGTVYPTINKEWLLAALPVPAEFGS
ncbi:MAG TPA: AAA family ATPase [Gemmataceae bacterium]|nr:AAA family ATPase [Gemmataceae bacterium]